MGRGIGLIGATLASGVVFAVAAPPAQVSAASITVTTTADVLDAAANCPAVTIASLPGPDGQTSLREAVCATNSNPGADTITFSVNGTFVLTGAANDDNGGGGDLDVKDSTQVDGNGTANTIIDGGGIERIFDVFPSSASTFGLSSLTVQNGDTRSTSFREGGAMYLHNNVTTTLTSVTVRNNFSGANGAIENRGTLTVTSSVISGNQTIPSSGSVTGGGMHNAGSLTITNSTFSDNSVRGEGGGLATTTGAAVTVSISNTTFSGNSASVTGGGLGNGGAISTTGNEGTINLTNVTISGNRADNNGGGAFIITPGGGTGNATFNGVTVTANIADNDDNGSGAGGGIAQATSAVTLRNTIVAGNFNSTAAVRDDISGALVGASSHNIVGDGTGMSGITNGADNNQVGSGASPIAPLLGPLAANGGPTLTHALLTGSTAIDTGNGATCAATDQRGVARTGTCDIGAFELTDATPPDTTITGTPTSPSSTATATFTFTGSDTGGSGLAGFECRIDAGVFAACTSPQTYAGLADGPHTFSVRARDGAGNADPTPANSIWTIDTTAPDTTISAGPTSPSTSSDASFSFFGTEGGSGLASFECRIDGGSFTACATPQSYTGLADGSHTVEVRAIDQASNVDPTPASYTWVVDATAPDTAITAQPDSPSASADASFSFSGTDAGTGVASFQCRIDGSAFAACTDPQTYTGLTDGPHTFDVRAVDAAGNVDPTPATRTWSIDTGAPGTSITAQPGNPSASAAASFSFDGDDGAGAGVASFECRIDGGGFAPCTSPQSYAGLADGPHVFEVRAVDGTGNVDPSPATFSWLVDTTAADTTITTPPTDPSGSADQSFSFSGDDGSGSGVVGFECRLDGAPFAPCTSPQLLTGLTDGAHTFQVRAVDGAGNVDASPASTTWVVDTAGPDTTITGHPADPSASPTATFTFTGSDTGSSVVGFQCRLDGATFTPCTSPASYAGLAGGVHTFEVRAIDGPGNPDPTPATSTWTIDTVAPETTVSAGPPSSTTETSASFTFGGSDDGGTGVARFECRVDGAAFAACTSPATYQNLSVGAHTFQVRAVDSVGNVDATPTSIVWTVAELASAAPETTAPESTTPATTTPASPVTTVPPTALPTVLPTVPSAGGRLPETGTDATQEWLVLGLVLLSSGAMLLLARRRGHVA